MVECPHLILVASPLRTLVEVALGILGVSQSNGQKEPEDNIKRKESVTMHSSRHFNELQI